MRILQVIDHLGLGGAQSMLVGLARLTARDGVEMSIVALRGEPEPALLTRLRDCCREVVAVDTRGLWDPRAVAVTAQAVRRTRADVVHTHLAVADVVGGATGRALRRPVVSSLHNVVADRLTHPLPRRTAARLATRRVATRLVAVSAAVRDSHVSDLGIDAGRIELIPNAPIAPLLLPADFDRTRKRAELGLGEGPVVSVAARLAPTKDHVTLLRAVPTLVARHPGLVLLVAGDGETRGALETLARELGVGDAVRFLGSRGDAVELVAASDVFCNATFELEGLPIAVLDALALGVPIVATRSAGVSEVAEDGRNALLVPERDPAALADAVSRLLSDKALAARQAAAGRASIVGALDPVQWAAAHVRLYRSLLEIT